MILMPSLISKLLILAAFLLLAFFYSTHRTPDDWISGHAFVVDGDSLEILDQRIRVFGIDAPEGQQTCKDADGADYQCGQTAANALTEIISNQPVKCEPIERDQYDRTVARCFLGDQDIAEWMVLNGHALAYREFTADYIDEEHVARTMERGMWQGEFQPPWEWRKDR